MPISNSNAVMYPSPGNEMFAVQVPSTAGGPVTFAADFNGQTVLAVVAPGGSAVFSSPEGFFFAYSAVSSYFTWQPVNTFASFNPVSPSAFLSNSTLGNNTLYMVPFDLQQALEVSYLNMFVSIGTTLTSSNQTGSGQFNLQVALYSKGTGAGSDSIGTFWSASQGLSFSCSSNTAMSFTSPLGTVTLATSNASTYLATSLGGFRQFPFAASLTLNPGKYWCGIIASNSNADASNALGYSIGQITQGNQVNYQQFGHASAASNVGSPGIQELAGTYGTTTTSFPATIAVTNTPVVGVPTLTVPFFNFSGFATNVFEG